MTSPEERHEGAYVPDALPEDGSFLGVPNSFHYEYSFDGLDRKKLQLFNASGGAPHCLHQLAHRTHSQRRGEESAPHKTILCDCGEVCEVSAL